MIAPTLHGVPLVISDAGASSAPPTPATASGSAQLPACEPNAFPSPFGWSKGQTQLPAPLDRATLDLLHAVVDYAAVVSVLGAERSWPRIVALAKGELPTGIQSAALCLLRAAVFAKPRKPELLAYAGGVLPSTPVIEENNVEWAIGGYGWAPPPEQGCDVVMRGNEGRCRRILVPVANDLWESLRGTAIGYAECEDLTRRIRGHLDGWAAEFIRKFAARVVLTTFRSYLPAADREKFDCEKRLTMHVPGVKCLLPNLPDLQS